MLIYKAIYEKNKCSRWVKNNEANKLKIIREPVLIESLFGTILAFLNYFLVRTTVYTTGEQFIPAFTTDADKYAVMLTWIGFSFIVLISIFQLISKGRIYISDDTLSKEEVKYYKYEQFKRFNKITLMTVFYITIYQVFFQMTIIGIDIKKTILWWVVIFNILIFMTLILTISEDRMKLKMMDKVIKELSIKIEKEDYSKISEEIKKIEDINKMRNLEVKITCRAIEDLLKVVEDVSKKENKSRHSKNELITNISHDLKTPLTSIINYVDFLKNRDLTEKEKVEYIGILNRKANRIKILLSDLKEISVNNKKDIQLKLQYISLKELLEEAILELKEKLEEARLEVHIEIKNEDKKIRNSNIDYDKTLRIFQNLLSNIIKYSKADTDVRIIVKQQNSMDFPIGYYTLIRFINISEDKIELTGNELVERFRRGDSSRNKEGNGLGLNIVENLVQLQGGELKVNVNNNEFIVDIIL